MAKVRKGEPTGITHQQVISKKFFETLYNFILKYGKADRDGYCYELKFASYTLTTSKSKEPVIDIQTIYTAKRLDGVTNCFVGVTLAYSDIFNKE